MKCQKMKTVHEGQLFDYWAERRQSRQTSVEQVLPKTICEQSLALSD